jgi:hypothetical protein
MNTLAQPLLNPIASAATTLPTPPTDERRSSPSSGQCYSSMSASALLDQPRRQQIDSLPSISLPQVSRPYSPSGSNLGGSLPTPPPGESYSSSGSNPSYSGYVPYNSQPSWPTSAPQHYSISMSDPNPTTNSPSGSYRGMSPNANPYPVQPVGNYAAYGGSPHSPSSRDSRNNSPYQGEYLPAPQGASLYNQPPQHQNSEQGHYQSYPPTNLPPLQHNPMMPQHQSSYQSPNSQNGGSYNNYFQYHNTSSPTAGPLTDNNSTLPPPLGGRAPLPSHLSHHGYPQYPQAPSSYPSSQPYGGSSNWRYASPPMAHSPTDPAMRTSPYARPPGLMRPGSGGMVVNNQDRPFKCDQCPQSFNRNHDLKRHKRIHLAVKPFPCPSCDKSFSRKDALKVPHI